MTEITGSVMIGGVAYPVSAEITLPAQPERRGFLDWAFRRTPGGQEPD